MGKRYRKYKSPKSVAAAKEVIESIEKTILRRKIKRLQQLPNDFRDLEPGTKAWQDFEELVPDRQEDMRTWASGPVLYFQELKGMEAQVLGHERLIQSSYHLQLATLEPKITWPLLLKLIEEVERVNASFIYLKGDKIEGLVNALNKIACIFHFTFRFKGTLKSVMDKEATLDMKIVTGR